MSIFSIACANLIFWVVFQLQVSVPTTDVSGNGLKIENFQLIYKWILFSVVFYKVPQKLRHFFVFNGTIFIDLYISPNTCSLFMGHVSDIQFIVLSKDVVSLWLCGCQLAFMCWLKVNLCISLLLLVAIKSILTQMLFQITVKLFLNHFGFHIRCVCVCRIIHLSTTLNVKESKVQ